MISTGIAGGEDGYNAGNVTVATAAGLVYGIEVEVEMQVLLAVKEEAEGPILLLHGKASAVIHSQLISRKAINFDAIIIRVYMRV